MTRLIGIVLLFVLAWSAKASDPNRQQGFEQRPNLEDIVVPDPFEMRGTPPQGWADVFELTHPKGGIAIRTVLTKVQVVRLDAKAQKAVLRVSQKDAAAIRQACRDGYVFLQQHKP
jgi:hypothetical protein